MRAAIVFATVILAAGPLLAQADSCVHRTIPVNVLNDQGQVVTGLAENNFIGSMHHQPVKVLSVKPDGTARRVVIVLDASGSMLDEKRLWHLYLAVGRNLITPMPAGTLAALVVFSSIIEKNIPLTDSKEILQDELTRIEPGLKALPQGAARQRFGMP